VRSNYASDRRVLAGEEIATEHAEHAEKRRRMKSTGRNCSLGPAANRLTGSQHEIETADELLTAQVMNTPEGRPPLLFETLTGKVRQTAYETHVYFGAGFLEKVYRNALAHRLRKLGIDVDARYEIKVADEDGTVVGEYFPDLMVDSKVVVEIKASRAIGHADVAQILNYLKATGRSVGLLINFGASRLEFRRFVRS